MLFQEFKYHCKKRDEKNSNTFCIYLSFEWILPTIWTGSPNEFYLHKKWTENVLETTTKRITDRRDTSSLWVDAVCAFKCMHFVFAQWVTLIVDLWKLKGLQLPMRVECVCILKKKKSQNCLTQRVSFKFRIFSSFSSRSHFQFIAFMHNNLSIFPFVLKFHLYSEFIEQSTNRQMQFYCSSTNTWLNCTNNFCIFFTYNKPMCSAICSCIWWTLAETLSSKIASFILCGE